MGGQDKIAEIAKTQEPMPPFWECENCGGRLLYTDDDIRETWNNHLDMCSPCAITEYSNRKKQ